jgi:hypothetical protein
VSKSQLEFEEWPETLSEPFDAPCSAADATTDTITPKSKQSVNSIAKILVVFLITKYLLTN